MLNIKTLFFVNFGLPQRLFNYIDDNALINLLAPLEVGQEVDTAAKANIFVNMSANEYYRKSFLLWGGWGSSSTRNCRKRSQKLLNASDLKDNCCWKVYSCWFCNKKRFLALNIYKKIADTFGVREEK